MNNYNLVQWQAAASHWALTIGAPAVDVAMDTTAI
jgi:hypothetical protein